MANGSHKEGPARADRLREKYAKHERQTQRAIDHLPPYREEMDSSEVTVNTKLGSLAAKGVPPWALGLTLVALAIAGAIVAILRFWPR